MRLVFCVGVAGSVALAAPSCGTAFDYAPTPSGSESAGDGSQSAGDGSQSATTASGAAAGAAGDGGSTASATSSSTDTAASSGSGPPPPCDETPCKLVAPQCGCAAGQKCTLDGLNQRTCLALGSSPKSHGALCSAESDCVAGAKCSSPSSSPSPYMCHAYCDTNADCVGYGTGSKCIWKLTQNYQIVAWMCTLACDLIGDSGCPAGAHCHLIWDSKNLSNVGTTCTGSGPIPYCNKQAPECAGGTCKSFTSPGPGIIDGVEYGYCAP